MIRRHRFEFFVSLLAKKLETQIRPTNRLNGSASMDPANQRARHRSALGLSRELQQDRTDHPSSPSRGGSRGYPLWFRLRVLDTAHTDDVIQASDQYGVSESSIYRWQERVLPYRMAGGEERADLVGYDLLLLALAITIYPCATLDEIATFILANGGDVYSNPQISERLQELQITRKRCAKEAYDAFSERTQRRVRWFMTLPPPLGVYRVLMRKLIDIDETGFYLKCCSPNYGRGLICQRVRNPSHYNRNAQRVNVILAIEPGDPRLPANVDGSIENPRRWLKITVANIDQHVFADFCDETCRDLENNPVNNGLDDERYFMWDNLTAHKTALVINTVEGRVSNNNFQTMNRPPYHPKLAPIEYVFCELACELSIGILLDCSKK